MTDLAITTIEHDTDVGTRVEQLAMTSVFMGGSGGSGGIGPAGPQGPAGPTGATGSVGAAGSDAADRTTLAALSIASGVVNVDCSLGDFFTLALTANVTSITFSNLPAAGHARSIAIRAKQDGTGSRTVALPPSFKASAGSDTAVQAAANAYTLLAITTFDQGTRWEYTMRLGAA